MDAGCSFSHDTGLPENKRGEQMKIMQTWVGAALVAASLSAPSVVHADTAALVAARSHYFGAENVDPRTGDVDKEKVIITWFSVQSYAVAARGHVFLMDSYIYRVSDTPGYVPTTVQELVDLKPEAIFIGHGHGDHADNAAYIAVMTGARIFGAAEHCAAMAGDADRIFGGGKSVQCTSLTTTGAAPGSEIRTIDVMRPDVCIVSFKHLHSGPAPLDPDYPQNLINPVRDPRVSELYPPLPPPTLNTRTMSGAGGSVSMFYQFSVDDFNFIWHDTNGPIKDFQPQLIPLLASLPKADVEIGSLVSTGESINGVRDVAMYTQLIKPKIFYGGHSDNFNIGASPYYHQALKRQYDIFGIPKAEQPEVRGLHDPYDYLRPGLATFEWKDKLWRETPEGKRAVRCP
jgi:hypothetical protein